MKFENIEKDIKDAENEMRYYLIDKVLKSQIEDWCKDYDDIITYKKIDNLCIIRRSKDFMCEIIENRSTKGNIYLYFPFSIKNYTLNKKIKLKHNQIYNYVENKHRYKHMKYLQSLLPITIQEKRKRKLEILDKKS